MAVSHTAGSAVAVSMRIVPGMATSLASPAQSQRQKHIAQALALPRPLLNFFRKHPPGTFSTAIPPPPAQTTSGGRPRQPVPARTITNPALPQSAMAEVASAAARANPFLPFRNPLTHAWRPAAYSQRRQAELYGLAARHGVLALLPAAPKDPRERLRRREEGGLRVKGTGVGQRVKGHAWERHLGAKLAARKKAMEDMPRLIREWKQKGHGRGWKKWPSGRAEF